MSVHCHIEYHKNVYPAIAFDDTYPQQLIQRRMNLNK
jgi:hypothetical protein